MTWGTFDITHIASLILAVGIHIALYLILRKRSDRTKTAVLFILSLSGIAAIIFNLVRWGSPLEYLPFHMCSITAMILPFAVITRNKTLGNLLLIWSLGAFMALLVNNAQAHYLLLSDTFFFYYFPHVFEAGIPILLFCLGLVKKDHRYIGRSVAITLGIYTAVHFINLAVNRYCAANGIVDCFGNTVTVNYMYSIAPSIPLLDFFYLIIPCEYFYMFMVIPILTVYLLIVYSPQLIEAYRMKSHEKKNKNFALRCIFMEKRRNDLRYRNLRYTAKKIRHSRMKLYVGNRSSQD